MYMFFNARFKFNAFEDYKVLLCVKFDSIVICCIKHLAFDELTTRLGCSFEFAN